MKVVGWIVLLLLVTLAAAFVGAKHLGVSVPLLDEFSRQGDISLPIAFVLLLFGLHRAQRRDRQTNSIRMLRRCTFPSERAPRKRGPFLRYFISRVCRTAAAA